MQSAFPIPKGVVVTKRRPPFHTRQSCRVQSTLYVLDDGRLIEDVVLWCPRPLGETITETVKALAVVAVACTALVAHAAHAGPTDTAVACLANNIYYEGAHEPFAGQVAIAQVTINRMADTKKSLCSVVYEKHTNADGKKVAAFSWTLGLAWRAPGPRDERLYARCLNVARRVLYGGLRSIIGPAVKSYHAVYVHPHWHKRFAVRIGSHLFYRG